MFHSVDQPLERGWVGRVDGDRVLHLAAQTLQHFFSGGASAREHAAYPLAEVVFLAPVLQPPAVRVFGAATSFAFANPAAVTGPGATVSAPPGAEELDLLPRLAALIGADTAIGGVTLLAEWRAPTLEPPKDRDFGLVLGPLVVTPDELPASLEVVARVDGEEQLRADGGGVDWEELRAYAAAGTELKTGDVLAAPAVGRLEALRSGALVEIAAEPIGVLTATAG
jgi:2-keto-4-pentenoate hydratase/2-oxohepta-3-ene-1,7-dioic acid hydratase in catechol pathway